MMYSFSAFLRSRLVEAVVLLGLAAHTAPVEAQSKNLTVVELYTSQGCSSCPPSDALLEEISQRADVLALSFHVDYWDYFGWKDSYATVSCTARQRGYARAFRKTFVSTPQMVVDGMLETTCSDARLVSAGIKKAAMAPHADIQ